MKTRLCDVCKSEKKLVESKYYTKVKLNEIFIRLDVCKLHEKIVTETAGKNVEKAFNFVMDILRKNIS